MLAASLGVSMIVAGEFEACAICRFYFMAEAGELVCRRLPPQSGLYGKTGFPLIEPESWCGEFAQRRTTDRSENEPLPDEAGEGD